MFRKLADRLARAGVSPNQISVMSVVFAAAACLTFVGTAESDHVVRRLLWAIGGICIQLRLLANLLDGLVAVEGGKASAVGDLYNEVPDRIADPLILTGLGFAHGGCPLLGLGAGLMSVFVAYVRAIGASAGVGEVFLGPCAKQHRMALVTTVALACAVLPSGLQPIHEPTGLGIAGVGLAILIVGCAVTAIRRLRRIARLMRERAEVSDAV